MNRMLTRCKLPHTNRWIPVSALLLGTKLLVKKQL